MIMKLWSGVYISCIPGITALNKPLAIETKGQPAKTVTSNEKRELN